MLETISIVLVLGTLMVLAVSLAATAWSHTSHQGHPSDSAGEPLPDAPQIESSAREDLGKSGRLTTPASQEGSPPKITPAPHFGRTAQQEPVRRRNSA
jgi:hypothetical protein